MLKFLYFTDPHVRIQSPTYRLDDFYQTILNKLKYVAELGKIHNVDAYICGGDFIDRPDIPYTTLTGLVETLALFKSPICCATGNHDLFGYNPATYHRTALSVVNASGIITRLSNDPLIFKDGRGTTVSLTGCDAHPLLDKNGRVEDYVEVPDVPSAVKIHTVHGFLATKPWPMVPVTTIDAIAHTKADIVLSGHEHSGFGVIKKGEKIFCNPGALARLTASVGDVNLEVKVALITVNGQDRDIELLKLPAHIARPAAEVIDREKMESVKKHKQALEQIMLNAESTLKDFSFGSDFNLYATLDKMVEDQDISPEIVETIRKYLQLAEEEISCATE